MKLRRLNEGEIEWGDMRGDRGRFARITDNRGIKINVFSASLRRTETET